MRPSEAGSGKGTVSAEHAATLRHMLGIDRPNERNPKPYRDYYCACPGDPEIEAMAALGLVERYEPRTPSEWHWYRTTHAGREAAFASHRATVYPKAKRVYLRYLSAADAYPGLTFREFLTHARFAEDRRSA